MNEYDAVMGEGVREYGGKEVRNLNTFIHGFYTPHFAFPFQRINIVAQKRVPDVSFYQKLIDWDKFRAASDVVIIRAGQGAGVDDYFFVNYAATKKRGMLRGVYWFYDGRVSPGTQADLLVGLLRDNLPEMNVWIDWERNYGGSFEGLQNVVAMMQRVELLLPSVKIGLYTGYYWFIGNSNPVTNSGQYTYLKTRPLWLAWYTADMSVVKIPNPWTALLLWQFGTPALGGQFGVATQEIDMSYFNGTEEDFYYRYGTPQGENGGSTVSQWKCRINGLAMRDGNGTTHNQIDTLYIGDVVDAVQSDVTGWLNISKITRANGLIVTKAGWCSGSTIYMEPVTAPPVPTVQPQITIDLAAGSVVTIKKDDGTQEVIKA